MKEPQPRFAMWEVLAELVGEDPETHAPLYRFYRVVHVHRVSKERIAAVALFELSKKSRLPKIYTASDAANRLESGVWIRSQYDPFVPKFKSEEDIPSRKRLDQMELISERMQAVETVLSGGWESIYRPRVRNELIQKAARDRAVRLRENAGKGSAPAIRKFLATYWLYGGSRFALVTGRLLNGSKKRSAQLAEAKQKGLPANFGKKRGPKPRSEKLKLAAGPNITSFLYTKATGCLMKLIKKSENAANLRRIFDRRHGVPYEEIRYILNKEIFPKELVQSPNGLQEAIDSKYQQLSRSQVKSICNDVFTVGDFVVAIKSTSQISLQHLSRSGDVRDYAEYAGQRYEVDPALTDVFLVRNGLRLHVGRIWLIFVVDSYSRMIAAIYPWSGTPTHRTLSYALAAAAMPKSEWGKIIGEDFSDDLWPCQGMPELAVGDGGEIAWKAGQQLAKNAFDIEINPACRAYLKGSVEGKIKYANCKFVDRLPGSTKGPKERQTELPEKTALASVSDLTRWMNRWAFQVANHQSMPNYPDSDELRDRNVKLTPISLWQDSMRAHTGMLTPYNRERHLPGLLPSRDLRVTKYGLDLNGVYFDYPRDECPVWFKKLKQSAAAGKTTPLRVHLDEMTLNHVYVVSSGPSPSIQPIPLSRLSRQYKDLCLSEVTELKKYRADDHLLNQRDHELRQTYFGCSVDAELAKAESDTLAQYGSLKNRDRVAAIQGKNYLAAAQRTEDAQRDQKFHPEASDVGSKTPEELTNGEGTISDYLPIQ